MIYDKAKSKMFPFCDRPTKNATTQNLFLQFWQFTYFSRLDGKTEQNGRTKQICLPTFLKMLRLYLLGQNFLHLTFKPYLSSETYSRQYEKLPSIVVHACKILQKKCICWKCLARKFGFVFLRFDPLRRNS